MTKTESRVAAKNILICGVGLFVLVAVSLFIISYLSGQLLQISLSISLYIICMFVFILFIVYLLKGHSSAGPVLLDGGPHKTNSQFRVTAGFGLAMVIWFFVQSISGGESRISGMFFWLVVSAYSWVISFGRLQLRQNGIWQYWSLLRWEDIGSYHWEGHSPPTLVLNIKRRYWIPFQSAMAISPDLKQQFDDILSGHVSSNRNQ